MRRKGKVTPFQASFAFCCIFAASLPPLRCFCSMPNSALPTLSAQHQQALASFAAQGYCVLKQVRDVAALQALREVAQAQEQAAQAPLEYEASTGYPGAPTSREAEGGHTVRRLLDAWQRHPLFQAQAAHPTVTAALRQILGDTLSLSRAHHNCMMTKHPAFGSATGWHRDVRYWSFENENLVSAWLALGDESPKNGGLLVLPGSHQWQIEDDCLDARKFLLPEKAAQHGWDMTPTNVVLDAGDVLLFHGRTFHAAGQNQSAQTKFSLVFTYHGADNAPLANTRSTSLPEVVL